MPTTTPISLGEIILFGYYLPAVIFCVVPCLQIGFLGLLFALITPFLLVIFGLPMTAYFPLEAVWEIYCGFAINLLFLMVGFGFKSKNWGKGLIILGLWGWTLASLLGVTIHG